MHIWFDNLNLDFTFIKSREKYFEIIKNSILRNLYALCPSEVLNNWTNAKYRCYRGKNV